MRSKPNVKAMENEVAKFNAKHSIGDTIMVWPGSIMDEPVAVQIIEPGAYVLSGHTAVVRVTGGRGSIALSHVA